MNEYEFRLDDPEAERHFVAWMLKEPENVRRYRALIKTQDFTDAAYGWLWFAAQNLTLQGRAVDPAAVVDILEGHRVDDVLDIEFVRDVLHMTPDIQAMTAASRIAEKALRRRLQKASNKIAHLAIDPTISADDLQSSARQLVRDASMTTTLFDKIHTPIQRAQAALDRYEQMLDGNVDVIPYGFAPLDAAVNGLRKGQLVIVAGKPGAGKSVLMHEVAQNAGAIGKKVLYVSVEMPDTDLTDRELSRWTGVNLTDIRRGVFGDGYARLAYGTALLSEGNVYTFDAEPITPSVIEAVADEMQAQVGLDLIVVDYLQIVTPDHDFGTNKRLAVEQVSGRLRQIARVFDVPVIAGSQLVKDSAGNDGRPQLEHLRETGAIAQDAFVVLGLYRPGLNDKSRTDDTVEVHILKNRNDGPAGIYVLLGWDGKKVDIYDPRQPRRWERMNEQFGQPELA